MAADLVFLVDDDETLRKVLERELTVRGFEVMAFASTDGVLAALRERAPQVVLLDLRLPGQDGMEFLRQARETEADAQIVVLTGHGSVEHAVEAMRLGAQDFLTKPVRLDVLEQTIRRVIERSHLVRQNRRLRRAAAAAADRTEILGGGEAICRLLADLQRIAASDNSVLILGENGTGKELVARHIHRLSARADQPFVVVDCAAIPDNLVESELFGHQKGAFTGADRRRIGLFEAADCGTLFLDELGDLPLGVQPALLRALQFGEIRPVGDHRTRQVDARIIASTNRPIREMIRTGDFREDLYYRIATLQVEVPPLRDRPEDIPMLAREFMARAAARAGSDLSLSADALERLQDYAWPGNVRELENAMVRLVVMCDRDTVDRACVERLVLQGSPADGGLPTLRLEDLERRAVEDAMKRMGGDKRRAAEALGIALKTLYNKLEKYGSK